jgi:hypothetical protein
VCHGGFSANLWSSRWKQRKELQASYDTAVVEDINDSDNAPMDMAGYASEEESVADHAALVAAHRQSTQDFEQSENNSSKVVLRDSMDLSRELAYSINKVRNKQNQRLLLGAVIKLTEIAKGNVENVSSQSLEELLDNQFNLFTRNMPSRPLFAAGAGQNKENSGASSMRLAASSMRLAAPPGSNGGNRLRSVNERTMNTMRDSNKRENICTLCHLPGHRVGRMCTVVLDAKAQVIKPKEVATFAAKLVGNPAFILVETPSTITKAAIKDWVKNDQVIPGNTKHVIVQHCYYSAKLSESFQMNVLEVSLLAEGGIPMLGYDPAYFPAYHVSTWMSQHCTSNGRKKLVLSSLAGPDIYLSQDMYDYSP